MRQWETVSTLRKFCKASWIVEVGGVPKRAAATFFSIQDNWATFGNSRKKGWRECCFREAFRKWNKVLFCKPITIISYLQEKQINQPWKKAPYWIYSVVQLVFMGDIQLNSIASTRTFSCAMKHLHLLLSPNTHWICSRGSPNSPWCIFISRHVGREKGG